MHNSFLNKNVGDTKYFILESLISSETKLCQVI